MPKCVLSRDKPTERVAKQVELFSVLTEACFLSILVNRSGEVVNCRLEVGQIQALHSS